MKRKNNLIMYSSMLARYLRIYGLKLALPNPGPEAQESRHSAGGGTMGFTRSAAKEQRISLSFLLHKSTPALPCLSSHSLLFYQSILPPPSPSQTIDRLRKGKKVDPSYTAHDLSRQSKDSSAPFGESRNGLEHTIEAT